MAPVTTENPQHWNTYDTVPSQKPTSLSTSKTTLRGGKNSALNSTAGRTPGTQSPSPSPALSESCKWINGATNPVSARGAMKPTTFVSKGKTIPTMASPVKDTIKLRSGSTGLGISKSDEPIRITSDVVGVDDKTIMGGDSTTQRSASVLASRRSQILALEQQWCKSTIDAGSGASTPMTTTPTMATPTLAASNTTLGHSNEKKRPAEDSVQIRDPKRQVGPNNRPLTLYSLKHPLWEVDLDGATCDDASLASSTSSAALTQALVHSARARAVANLPTNLLANGSPTNVTPTNASINTPIDLTADSPPNSTRNSPERTSSSATPTIEQVAENNTDPENSIALENAGDRPYSIWRGPTGKLEWAYGALLPTGYKMTDDPTFRFACPLLECRFSGASHFRMLSYLGIHFKSHRGVELNDNRDGTFTIVRRKPYFLRNLPPIVVSRSPLETRVPRGNTSPSAASSPAPSSPPETTAATASASGVESPPIFTANTVAAAFKKTIEVTGQAYPPGSATEKAILDHWYSKPKPTAWEYLLAHATLARSCIHDNYDMGLVGNRTVRRLLPDHWVNSLSGWPTLRPMVVISLLAYISGSKSRLVCGPCASGRQGKNKYRGDVCIVVPVDLCREIPAMQRRVSCACCMLNAGMNNSANICDYELEENEALGEVSSPQGPPDMEEADARKFASLFIRQKEYDIVDGMIEIKTKEPLVAGKSLSLWAVNGTTVTESQKSKEAARAAAMTSTSYGSRAGSVEEILEMTTCRGDDVARRPELDIAARMSEEKTDRADGAHRPETTTTTTYRPVSATSEEKKRSVAETREMRVKQLQKQRAREREHKAAIKAGIASGSVSSSGSASTNTNGNGGTRSSARISAIGSLNASASTTSTASANTKREKIRDKDARGKDVGWEVAPGVGSVDLGYGPKALAFSHAYLFSADPVNIDPSLQAHWLALPAGRRHIWPARDDRTRIVTVTQGRVRLVFGHVDPHTEMAGEMPPIMSKPIVISRRGDFKIPLNVACEATGVDEDAEVHVVVVVEPGALMWEREAVEEY